MDLNDLKNEKEKEIEEKEIEQRVLLNIMEMIGAKTLAKLHKINMQADDIRMEILNKYINLPDNKLDKEKVNKIEKVFSDNLKNLQELEKELED